MARVAENRQIQLRRLLIPPDKGSSRPHKALIRAGEVDTLEPLALHTSHESPGGPERGPSDCPLTLCSAPGFDLSSIHTKTDTRTETLQKICLLSRSARGLREARRAWTLFLGFR